MYGEQGVWASETTDEENTPSKRVRLSAELEALGSWEERHSELTGEETVEPLSLT